MTATVLQPARKRRYCVYCAAPTKGAIVCANHRDLAKVDEQHPASWWAWDVAEVRA